jgi:hypothetical protein
MSKTNALASTIQKTVVFYGDELVAIRAAEDGEVYVSVRHLCDVLNLTRRSQVARINRNEVLEEGYRPGIVTIPPYDQQVEMGMLRVDLVPLFLAGISINRIKDEAIREKLKLYQKRAAKVLWEAFQEGRLTLDQEFEALLETDSAAVQAYKMAAAVMKLARQQIILEAKLDQYGSRLEDHDHRLEEIEATLSQPERYLTREQASRISQAVRAIGLILTKQTGQNQYGAVYGELYRRYDISAYRELPSSQYEDAMQWLNEWRQSLVDDVEF